MGLATIKKEFLNDRVAFGTSADPLYKRDDIDQLAIIAHESQNPNLLKLFEVLPPLAELKKSKTDTELKLNSPIIKLEGDPALEENREDPNLENKMNPKLKEHT